MPLDNILKKGKICCWDNILYKNDSRELFWK